MDIVLNQIAIWLPCRAKELNVRRSPAGRQYREPDTVVYKQSARPLIRYAKDYTVKKVGFSLFLHTECEDTKKVEAALDYYASKVTKEYALQATANANSTAFEYTPYIFNETQVIAQEDK